MVPFFLHEPHVVGEWVAFVQQIFGHVAHRLLKKPPTRTGDGIASGGGGSAARWMISLTRRLRISTKSAACPVSR